MTVCDDCAYHVPADGRCIMASRMTDGQRRMADDGRCPVFEEYVLTVAVRYDACEMTVRDLDALLDILDGYEDVYRDRLMWTSDGIGPVSLTPSEIEALRADVARERIPCRVEVDG